MSVALDCLTEALRREVRGKKDPPRTLVRVTGSPKGTWHGALCRLTTTGSGVEIVKTTLDHLDDAAAWTALLDEIRGGALR